MIKDLHYHINYNATPNEIVEYFDYFRTKFNIENIAIQSVPIAGKPQRLQNLKVLMVKDMMYPYAFAGFGLWHGEGHEDYLTQLENGLEQGFDSVKMLEGKPNKRKELGKPLCDSSFDLFYSAIEEKNLGLLMHLGDPPKSWDRSTYPPGVVPYEGFYDEPGFCTLEELYAEVDEILRKHPRLKLTLAHLYSMDENLPRAAEFLEKHPNVSFDITPGCLFDTFSSNPGEASEFFSCYADRLILGSDMNDGLIKDHHVNLYKMIIGMLTGSDIPDFTNNPYFGIDIYKPLSLSEDVQHKIMYENFAHFMGDKPRKTNRDAIVKEIQRIEKEESKLSESDKENLDIIRKYYL